MRQIILDNGHLVLEGNETAEDLLTALKYLREHTLSECHRPYLGADISTFFKDGDVLEKESANIAARKERYLKRKNASIAGSRSESE